MGFAGSSSRASRTPLRGQVTVAASVLGNAVAQNLVVGSVRTTILGSYQFDGAWTLTNLLESRALRGMIGQQRSANPAR